MLPTFFPRARLPWILAAVAVALIVSGAVTGDRTQLLLGGGGVALAVVAFPLASVVVGKAPPEPARPGEDEGLPPAQ
jgi:hypothetical protein